MRTLPLAFTSLALVLAVGCSDSVGVAPVINYDLGTDAGLPGDGGSNGTDAGLDAGVDSGSDGGTCGNGFLDPNEACDDGNLVDTDVCRNDCSFSPICGDGTQDANEECDDGNNGSGDGCSGRCTIERCGNGLLDVGEVCDGTTGCAADCKSVTTCGDGKLDAGEQCDDSNVVSWDGCSSACLVERAMVLSEANLLVTGGCDLTGDGLGDSLLGGNLQELLGYTFVTDLIRQSIQTSPFNVLAFQGVEDASLATDDPSVRVAWVQGNDANGGAMDFDGNGQVRVVAGSVPMGEPLLSFPGSIATKVLNAGPEDITLPFLMGIDIGLHRARIVDTTITVAPNGGNPRYSVGTTAGMLCGVAQVRDFASFPNLFAALGNNLPIQVPTTSCDTTAVPTNQVNMADVLVGGAAAGGFFTLVYGVQPDVDYDGDGLESYQLATGTNCQAVITGCVDGDGTVIPGHGCVTDPRMQDGWSAAFRFTAPSTTIVP